MEKNYNCYLFFPVNTFYQALPIIPISQLLTLLMTLLERILNLKLFLPVSGQLISWYFFVILFMLVDLVLTVIVNCFAHGRSKVILFQVINNLLPIVLIVDILISFNVGFIKNGKIILNRKAANRQYIKTVYFWCDIITLITSILQIIFQNTFMTEITIFNYLIFIKLTTAYFLDSLIKKYVIKSYNALIFYEVIKNFLILGLISHLIGSFYFYIDVLMYQNNWYGQQKLWIFSAYAFNNIYTSDFWIQYTYSYYVACVTLSGTAYGDIVPLNPYQNLYIFCCFVFPMLIYSYVYSSIFLALFNRRSATAQIRRYKFLAKQYLQSLGVTNVVINKILTFLQFTHKKKLIVDTQFINGLAPTIKKKYLDIILEGKFEYDCFNPLLQISQLHTDYLTSHLKTMIKQQYFPEKISLLQPEKLKIYYINSGKVVQVVRLGNKKKLSKPIQKFTHVAKTAFFSNQIPSNRFSYESNSFVMTHSIDYKYFKDIIKRKMPILNEAYCYIQWKILDEGQYSLMGQKCFFCQDTNHCLKDCPCLNFDTDNVANRIKYEYQERQFFGRDQLQKHTLSIRPNILKKQKIFRKLSKSYQEMDFRKDRRSKKIYESKSYISYKELLNFAKDKFLGKQVRSAAQQTTRQDLFGNQARQISKYKQIYFEKVCDWDKFYPERNIKASLSDYKINIFP